MDDMVSQVWDRLIASFIDGKISAEELKERYQSLRTAVENNTGEPATQPTPVEQAPVEEVIAVEVEEPPEPVDRATAQARHVKALMDQLQAELQDARTFRPTQREVPATERVDYIAYLAKRL